MTRYVAFLRGINVGGNKLIRMADLSHLFSTLNLKNVSTYIQSGNVIFDANEGNANVLTRKIGNKIQKSLGHKVPVMPRTIAELQAILRSDPFKRINPETDVMMFVAFLSEAPIRKPKLPLISSTEKLEVFAIRKQVAFILSFRKKTGWFGFPNNFIEKELCVAATTRNWTTVRKIVAVALAKNEKSSR